MNSDVGVESRPKFGYKPTCPQQKRIWLTPIAWGELNDGPRQQLLRDIRSRPGVSLWVRFLLDNPQKIALCARQRFHRLHPAIRRELIEALAQDGHFTVTLPRMNIIEKLRGEY